MKKRVLSCFLSFLLLFSLPIAVPVTAESVNDDLCVMSYNRGSHTASDVAVLVQQYQPDTFGLQEDHADFLQDLSALLGNSYAYVGTASKGNGVGEHCAVFYQTECFDLVDSGTRWLSETPNEVSKGNDTSQDQARILTYALLKRKSDGQCVLHLNTHLDNKGGWLEQIGYVFDFLNEYNSEYPVVMTGDFNRDPSSEAYANIIAKGFSDSRMIARTVTDELGYTIRTTVTNSSGEEELVQQRIDFAFVKGVSHVAAYQLHTDGIEDDHFPVLVTYGLALRGEVDEGFENTNNTAYTPGYVLHHMDFAQIVSLEQTKYLFEVETTANGGSADNNFVLRNSDYEGQTDQKVLFYDYQRNGKNRLQPDGGSL